MAADLPEIDRSACAAARAVDFEPWRVRDRRRTDVVQSDLAQGRIRRASAAICRQLEEPRCQATSRKLLVPRSTTAFAFALASGIKAE
jgi:hypothetical protein